MTFDIVLTADPPTGNSRLHRPVHWARTRQAREQARIQAEAARHREGLPAAKGKRCVTMTLVRGYRRKFMDEDNLHAYLKPVFDGLTSAKLIENDSPQLLERHVSQVKDANERRILIHVVME